jgi:hypothetical protein
MDFSKFKTPDWLMIGGGAAMLILGMALDWTSVDTGFGTVTIDGPFNYFITGGLAWLLVVAVAVLVILKAMDKLPDTQPWPLIFLGATGVAVLLMLIQLLLGGREGTDRGIGMIGAFIWAAIALAGAFLNFQASGGDIKDLTDVDKLKASFSKSGGSGGDEMPPPPPPSDQTPPPPPPPSDQTPPPPPPPAI